MIRPGWTAINLAGTLALIVPAGTAPAPRARPCGRVLLADRFAHANGPHRLITNQHALKYPRDRRSVASTTWQMTSGSLFSIRGLGWTGRPDVVEPNARSTNGTNSAVFRLRTRRADFTSVRIDVDLRVNSWVIGRGRETQEPEILIWTGFANERHLYAASVLRRTGQVDVEKKIPVANCAPADRNCFFGGDYFALAPYNQPGWPVKPGRWYHLTVTTVDNPDGTVAITILRDGARMTQVLDRGAGDIVQGVGDGRFRPNPAAPITTPGRVGIRGDNADFSIDNFRVSAGC